MSVRRLESRQQLQEPDRLVVEVDSAAVLGADEPLIDDGVKLRLVAAPAGENTPGHGEEMTDCWFGEPEPGDRRSWALPPAHGTYHGLDLELLDRGDEDERTLLMRRDTRSSQTRCRVMTT